MFGLLNTHYVLPIALAWGFSCGEDGRSGAYVTAGLMGAKEEGDKKQTNKAFSDSVKCYWKQ